MRSTHVYFVPDSPTVHRQGSKDEMEELLALPQDVHDRAFEGFATTCEGKKRSGSSRPFACTGGYPPDQLFDVE